MRGHFRSVPVKCPRCVPFARVLRHPDGRRLHWEPEALYVGFLLTDPYEGWKRPPQTCPHCGTAMEALRAH
jgi:ribosomal protein S27AE